MCLPGNRQNIVLVDLAITMHHENWEIRETQQHDILELFSNVKVQSRIKHGATQTFSNSILEGEKDIYSCYHSLINL